jgi:hypothetical protein
MTMTTPAMATRSALLLVLLPLGGGWGCREDPPPAGQAPPPMPDAASVSGRDGATMPRTPDPDASPLPDAGAAEAAREAGAPPDGSADAPGAGDAAAVDAAPAGLALTRMAPLSAARGAAVRLELGGSAFAPDAVVLFDGQPLATTWVSDTTLTAQLPAERTTQPGFSPVLVQNGANASAARSNPSNFLVAPPVGWPEVLEYQPDNGAPGDTIRIVGFNLSDQSVRLTDATGRAAPPGRVGTVNGPGVILESLELTLPAQWQSGPITVTNALGSFRAKVFNLGRNLATLPGVTATASSEYGEGWTIARGTDNDLYTSWFPAAGDCVSAGPATCTRVPFYQITFPAPQTVGRIALRGNREYTTGYDFLRARFEVLGPGGAPLWSAAYELPEPDRDLDITLPTPIPNATAVRFTSERDESEDPGFGELEVFAP